jgi:pimeloyl-ACP methyl ester carboxylesterase
MATVVEPFTVDISPADLGYILDRVASARLPRQMPPSSASDSAWETGMDMAWLDHLRTFWLKDFDWKREEEALNAYPQFRTKLEGVDLHFYHVKSTVEGARDLLLLHGWPGSVVEFLHLIEPLAFPEKNGGSPSDAYNVIIPSLPGFGFSGMPERPINSITTARIFNSLMTEVLGKKRYFVQGGDFGGGIAVALANQFPNEVAGIHLNFVPWFDIPEGERTPKEREWLAVGSAYAKREFDYMNLQANKPMMPAIALADSPLGTAAWIAEKFWAWSDNRGDLDKIIPMKTLLTNVMLYLVGPGRIDGSLWFYRGFRDEMNWSFFPGYISRPTAVAAFPVDYPVSTPSMETAKRGFNVVHYTAMPRGGHFASLEAPDLLLEDIRKALRTIPV